MFISDDGSTQHRHVVKPWWPNIEWFTTTYNVAIGDEVCDYHFERHVQTRFTQTSPPKYARDAQGAAFMSPSSPSPPRKAVSNAEALATADDERVAKRRRTPSTMERLEAENAALKLELAQLRASLHGARLISPSSLGVSFGNRSTLATWLQMPESMLRALHPLLINAFRVRTSNNHGATPAMIADLFLLMLRAQA